MHRTLKPSLASTPAIGDPQPPTQNPQTPATPTRPVIRSPFNGSTKGTPRIGVQPDRYLKIANAHWDLPNGRRVAVALLGLLQRRIGACIWIYIHT